MAAGIPAASYEIAENGSVYSAEVQLEDAGSYLFSEPGMLGEQVPVEVSGVRLYSPNGSAAVYEEIGRSTIEFPRGNYTLVFSGPLRNSHLQQVYDRYYRVNVTVPSGFDVRNPLLGGWSPGAEITTGGNMTTVLAWERTRELSVRFYDPTRESLLWFFATAWAAVAIVLLFPFVLSRLARRGRN